MSSSSLTPTVLWLSYFPVSASDASVPKNKLPKWISIYRVAGGRIAEQWINVDSMGMLQQLGVIPPPGQGGS